ncbi:HD domain-containing protein [Aquibacillus salsiterrae]|uniref:HD domain-containing protein n=1 Tax=Aquibacillus salsiterrae TaxID=2950439 RepID=A0A9X3WEZ9_9BACI|nr:HD domain-containing protein [Aquibacillus salsiterrae]MDC3417045.1 HD domain-containing protein [Aquibacillus salsiterrae]
MNLMNAIEYAAKKHEGQRRKVDGTPYISHPYRVGMLLMQDGYKEELVIAGILHDVVEDTSGTIEEIKSLFGDEVAELVFYASEPDKSLSWEDRKQHTIETMKTAPLEAKIVVCADKVDNLTSILNSEKELGNKVWGYFTKDKASQQWYYTSMYQSLTTGVKNHPKLFHQFNQLLEQLRLL